MGKPKLRLPVMVAFWFLGCVALTLAGCGRFDFAADFTASPTSGKKPLTVQFTPAVEGNARRFVWSFGDGDTSRKRSPEHTYTSAGAYTVILLAVPRHGDPVSVRKEDYITVTAGFGSTPGQLVVQDDDFSVGLQGDVQASVNWKGDLVYVLDVLANDSPADGATQLEIVAVYDRPSFPDDRIEFLDDLDTARGTYWISRPGRTAIEYKPYSHIYTDYPDGYDTLYYLATDGQTSAVGEVEVSWDWSTEADVVRDNFTILGASDVPRVPDPDCGLAWQLNVLDNDSFGDGPTELTIVGIRARPSEIWRDKESIDGWVYTEAAQYIRISPDGKAILLAYTGGQTVSFDTFYYLASNGAAEGEGIVNVRYDNE